MMAKDINGIGLRTGWLQPQRISLCIGGVLWLSRVALSGVAPLQTQWAVTLLLLSPLVLFPLLLELLRRETWPAPAMRYWPWIVRLQGPAAWLLVPACTIEQGVISAVLTLPWLLLTVLIASCGVMRFRSRSHHPPAELCLDAGLVYVVVGSTWLLLWRLGHWPLGYKEVIAMLTAIHFHYAGILLPAMTAWAARRRPGALATAACLGVIVGIPLTAVGITSTHFGFSPVLECVIVWGLSLAAMLTAWLQFSTAMQSDASATGRVLLTTSSVCLMGAMMLSALYGMRDLGGPAWLDIPWMRALHGTANALGTCLCGLLGWLSLPHNVSMRDLELS